MRPPDDEGGAAATHGHAPADSLAAAKPLASSAPIVGATSDADGERLAHVMTTLHVTEAEARQWLADTDAEIAEAERESDEEDAREDAREAAFLASLDWDRCSATGDEVVPLVRTLVEAASAAGGVDSLPAPRMSDEQYEAWTAEQKASGAWDITAEEYLIGFDTVERARLEWAGRDVITVERLDQAVAEQAAAREEILAAPWFKGDAESEARPNPDVLAWLRSIAEAAPEEVEAEAQQARRQAVIAEARAGYSDDDDREAFDSHLDSAGALLDAVATDVLRSVLVNLGVLYRTVMALQTAESKRLLAESEALRRPRPQPLVGSVAELLAMDSDEAYRIEGLLPTGGRLLLSAQKKVGKTTTLGNLCHSLLTGEPFLGRFATKPVDGTVVVLNYEVTGKQFAAWMHDLDVPADRLVVVNLRGRENLLASDAKRERLSAMLREHNASVLIVDPFGRAFTGEDQNAAGSVTPWLVMLDEVAEEGGCTELVLAAHTGWNGERTRGSTALEDWPDSIMRLTKDDSGVRFVSAEGRDVEVAEDRLDFDPATRRLTMAGTGGRSKAKRSDREEALKGAVRMAVAAVPDMYVAEVEAWLKEQGTPTGRSGSVAAALTAAVVDGDLVMREGERNRKHYSLAVARGAAS